MTAGGVVPVRAAEPPPDAPVATAAPEPVTWDPPLPGAWARDFRLGEWLGDPVTPLFESWLLTRIEERTQGFYAKLIGIELPRPAHVIVNGWYFYGLNFLPTSRRALLAMMLRHVVPRLLRDFRRTAIAFPPLARFAVSHYETEWRATIRPGYLRLVQAAADEVEVASAGRLVTLIDELADAAGRYFVAATAVAGYASKAEFPLARFHRAHLADAIDGSHLDLLSGLGDGVATPPAHAVRTIDWIEPTLGESGAQDGASAIRRHGDARARRQAAEMRARTALASDPRRLRAFERLLGEAQQYGRVREELLGEWTLPWPILRLAVKRLGAELVERRAIEAVDDVWFLTRAEVVAELGGGTDVSETAVAERRRIWHRQRRLVPPLRLGTIPPIVKSFIDSAEDAVRGGVTPLPDTVDLVVGLPASAGRVSGPARIIHSVDEAEQLQQGDVLVAPITAPAWVPLFDRVVGIVTDTGGVASHASIVAREYGIPAVVGTTDATRRIQDGEIIEVNGSTGVVRRMGPSPSSQL